jgi:methionyl-tRNA formyltransferase
VTTPRLGFAGTPQFAAVILEQLLAAGHPMEIVLTQPDRPSGRGRRRQASAVKLLAQRHHIPVAEPARLGGHELDDTGVELLIVAAYGLILPPRLLESPRFGCVNVHASLLPRWRGAAPVERAIMAGDTETGVCIMQMDAGLDTGPVYDCARLAIGADETGGALEQRLAHAGARLLVSLLPRITTIKPEPQPTEGATYAAKITARDQRLDFAVPAANAARRIRALADRAPITVADADGTARIRLLAARIGTGRSGAEPGTILGSSAAGIEVACAEGSLLIERVQLNRGKGRPMAASAAANGFPDLFATGCRLTAIGEPS